MEQSSRRPGDDFWNSFTHDPRNPASTALRASDRDRDAVHEVLAEAYADGRLDRAEFDLRSDQAASARTLGELPGLVGDLVATGASTGGSSSGGREVVAAGDLRAQAVWAYEKDRREALLGFLGPSLICVVIWAAFSGGFFWPAFVLAATFLNVIRTVVRRHDIVDEHLRKLEKKQARELEARNPEEIGPADDA